MFERNSIDNKPATSPVPVAITYLDRTQEKGKLFVAIGRDIQDCLNNTNLFLEFEPYGGDRTYLAKTQIAAIKPIGIPKAPSLSQHSQSKTAFDPHKILGVKPTAEWSEIRRAYVVSAKRYHPDRYATAELPDEVLDYLAAHARRINLAFELLEDSAQAKKANSETVSRSQPIYTSTPTR